MMPFIHCLEPMNVQGVLNIPEQATPLIPMPLHLQSIEVIFIIFAVEII